MLTEFHPRRYKAMKPYGSQNSRCSGQELPYDDFYSVEFSVNGIKLLYQSKLWNSSTAPMFALVKEDSDILNRINVGDVLNMKYYSTDVQSPTRNYDTKIEFISRDHDGRFKGHYLVGLAILPDQNREAQSSPIQLTG